MNRTEVEKGGKRISQEVNLGVKAWMEALGKFRT